MKKLSIILAASLLVLSASAQRRHHRDWDNDRDNRTYNNGQYNNGQYNRYNNTGVVNITLANANDQVYIDGRNYTPGNYRNGYSNTLRVTDLQPGQHTLQVNTGRSSGILGGIFGGGGRTTSKVFTVSGGYETDIAVNANGRARVSETRMTTYQDNRYYRNYDRDHDNDNR